MKYFVTFFLLVLFGMMVKGGMFLLIPPGSGEESVIYDLKPGTGLGKAAHDLESLGIVSNQLEFRILARLLKSSNNIKVGEYE
ncbi:MAG: hypothetical protein KDD50_07905, partial [Bdellovibrionales bacterium]|nr:hypothetical protein [Bdellovibrionales bacterium]